jgi:hypothetical protein
MSLMKDNCDACGAPARGLICEHCGKPTAHLESAADENRALDEFHKYLQELNLQDKRNWLLSSGFIPDTKQVLIEAGIYCVPLLKNMEIYDAAAARLEAVILKLKLMETDEQARRAVEDFQAQIEKYRAKKRSDDILGVGCLLLLLAAMVAFGWWLVKDAGWSVAVPIMVIILVVVCWLLFKK